MTEFRWYSHEHKRKFSDILGQVLTKIENDKANDEIVFHTDSGRKFVLGHFQECCEWVRVEDITGDLYDLIGSPITLADESVSEKPDQTWTFYKLATVKGYVTLRWLGESNGYYSESVDFVEVATP